MPYKPNFNPDGDMMIGRASRFTQDFKIFGTETRARGIFYPETFRSVVYTGEHECIEDIIQSCVHETIHGLIEEEKEDNDLLIDIEQEHTVIRQMAWAPESLV